MRYATLAALLFSFVASAQDGATYRVTLDASWSAQTHPQSFPGDPHFSPLVGAVHNADARLWEAGGIASNGMEEMAESGRTVPLTEEASALITAGSVRATLRGGAIGLSPGSAMMDIEVTQDHPLITLVTMLAPSPDWFIGTESLDLREGTGWVQSLSVPMYVWDAGTDSGPNYTSPNDDTSPAEPIARIETAPFLVGGTVTPVGTMTFDLLTTTTNEEGPETALGFRVSPNPARTVARVSASTVSPGAQVKVFDALGRQVREVVLSGAEAEVDVSGLAPGMYTVRLVSREGTATRSLVVAR
ncbi:MAG: spondin domain-containing protein [Bacteroidota bacterium]